MSVDLTNLPFEALEALFATISTRSGNPAHRAGAVLRGLYRDFATELSEIDGLARDFRDGLSAKAHIGRLEIAETRVAEDGTTKFLIRLGDGAEVESVWIPARWGNTLCISSQVGCAMGCTFCHTGTMGLLRNLTTAEIVGQVVAVASSSQGEHVVDGIVFMGMGEPLHNYDAVSAALHIFVDHRGFGFSHNRVTVSTVGLPPEIERLGGEHSVNLCVSLHAANDELRSRIVPTNRKYSLAAVMDACRNYPEREAKRMMFAYTVLPGVNDRATDAEELTALLEGLPLKVNLIPFNPYPGCSDRRPTHEEMLAFQQKLMARGFRVLYRTTRGAEIEGACGQLATASRRR